VKDLGLLDFKLQIEAIPALDGKSVTAFSYSVFFEFASGKHYTGRGTAPSWLQCVDLAEAYLAECVRDAVKA
jgi:hypothetical protein